SPPVGPAEAPWRLALVTVMQFAENLSDRQAADAVRSRIDWKYTLGLELSDPGFDHTVLCAFRDRLVEGGAQQALLDLLLERCKTLGLLKARGTQRTDSTLVLGAARGLSRLALVRETMHHTLESLARVAPDWLREQADPQWVERYQQRFPSELPRGKEGKRVLAETIGQDGAQLLQKIYASNGPPWLREVAAVEVLRQVWVQNYWQSAGESRWRTEVEGLPPSARFISSPYDLDTHYSRKGTSSWIGYKVHLTETCDEELPHLITHVETTTAPTADGEVTAKAHEALQQGGLLPAVHLVDTGFLNAQLLVESQRHYGVELLGPTRRTRRWQTRAGDGFGLDKFVLDFQGRKAICPEGKESQEWVPRVDNRRNDSIYIRFSSSDCGPCPSREKCTKSKAKYPRRSLTVRPQEQYQALKLRREQEETASYQLAYSKRAGIEGTISQGVRAMGMRRSRYLGLIKTHLGHVVTAAAINLVRVGEWLAGTPRATTRQSKFAAVMLGQ
ncbi:MAG TPA: IS1182 family transposase, partial [Dehalococcoidia bacterium]|nr:IS1182 family transposase [Dehalococcoidia bacterium]